MGNTINCCHEKYRQLPLEDEDEFIFGSELFGIARTEMKNNNRKRKIQEETNCFQLFPSNFVKRQKRGYDLARHTKDFFHHKGSSQNEILMKIDDDDAYETDDMDDMKSLLNDEEEFLSFKDDENDKLIDSVPMLKEQLISRELPDEKLDSFVCNCGHCFWDSIIEDEVNFRKNRVSIGKKKRLCKILKAFMVYNETVAFSFDMVALAETCLNISQNNEYLSFNLFILFMKEKAKMKFGKFQSKTQFKSTSWNQKVHV